MEIRDSFLRHRVSKRKTQEPEDPGFDQLILPPRPTTEPIPLLEQLINDDVGRLPAVRACSVEIKLRGDCIRALPTTLEKR